MFTGIIETIGTISGTHTQGSNLEFTIHSNISNQLKVDQSVSHDGVCLTVVESGPDFHIVTAIEETLLKSSLRDYKTGYKVNLERSMLNNGRFDGHIVQGHVDQIGRITSIEKREGSWIFRVNHKITEHVTVEKGSVTLHGISLTCFDVSEDAFSVAIIPYTYQNTNLQYLNIGDKVNLEFDIIGKYVSRLMSAIR